MSGSQGPARYRVHPAGPPRGAATIPGDKSITHRGLILGALAEGETVLAAPNRGADCLSTAEALRRLGVAVEIGPDRFTVVGRPGALVAPDRPLDLGNSGTGIRLIAGALAGQPFATTLDGDASLRGRPMGRIVEPLRAMGATIDGEAGGERLPLTIHGGGLRGVTWRTKVASAQVKSAILLAGLSAEGRTEVIEPGPSRDHTEKMIAYFGGTVDLGPLSAAVTGGQRLRGTPIDVGADPSSAAFYVVAGLIIPGADLVVRGIVDNRTRTAFLDVLERMGGRIERRPVETVGPEPRMDVRIRASKLRSTEIAGDEVPRLIDEIPILAVAGASAEPGERLVVRDAAELRVKESDRIRKSVELVTAFGAKAREHPDGFDVDGGRLTGTRVDSGGDHRIAMAAAVAGLAAAEGETIVDDVACVGTSLPEFLPLWASFGLGGAIVLEA